MALNPSITIIVPVRNRQGIVTRTLDSIAAQSYRPFRLIIVDNDSTDGTMSIVTKWKHAHESESLVIDILSETEHGASAARNRGLDATGSEYVMFFDSDDEMLPHHLQRIAGHLSRFPDTDILYWDIAYIDPDGWMEVKGQSDSDLLRCHLLHGTLSTQRFIARTSLLRQVGAWDTGLSIWLDLELGTRLLIANPTARKLHGEPSVLIHPTDDSITGTDSSSRADALEQALDKIDSLFDDSHSYYRSLTNARRAILAAHYRRENNNSRAESLMKKTLAGKRLSERIALTLIYHALRLTGHGGALIASSLFRNQPQNKLTDVNQSPQPYNGC